ncbi:MAG: hypothetical protein EOO73_29010 [Myxococcales bacterium]|nr:MAG: hypothetical protein EOO73_29010 [Myxococcales bacterium]
MKLLSLGVLLAGCDDPLKSVELVAEARVLGGRVEVTGEPERAAPAPGENATARLLLASPSLNRTLGFALAACPASPRNGARGECGGEVFARISSENGASDTPSLTFTVPSELDPSGRLLLTGVVCPESSPNEDGQSCEGAQPGTSVQLELELAHEDDVNLNPELQADAISFDDDAWPEVSPIGGDCSGLGFPEVAPLSEHSLTVQLDESDRDALPRPSELDPARESLQLSHFVTDGDISRAFESIAWDSGELKRTVTWKAPPASGLVRFWFVLRDLRGGGAFTERAVCVE